MNKPKYFSVGEFLRFLIAKWWIFLLVFVLGSCISFLNKSEGITHFEVTSKVLLSQEKNESATELYDNASRIQIVYDGVEIVSSEAFLEKVSEKLSFESSTAELKNSISVEQIAATRVLKITLTSVNQEFIENVREVLLDELGFYMQETFPGVKVNVLDKGTVVGTAGESMRTEMLSYIAVGILLCMLVFFILLLCYILEDRVQTERDIEYYLDIPVLGSLMDKTRR